MCEIAMLCAKNMCATALSFAEEHANSPVMCRRTCVQQSCHVQKNILATALLCAEEHVCNIPAVCRTCVQQSCYVQKNVVQQPCHVQKHMSNHVMC